MKGTGLPVADSGQRFLVALFNREGYRIAASDYSKPRRQTHAQSQEENSQKGSLHRQDERRQEVQANGDTTSEMLPHARGQKVGQNRRHKTMGQLHGCPSVTK